MPIGGTASFYTGNGASTGWLFAVASANPSTAILSSYNYDAVWNYVFEQSLLGTPFALAYGVAPAPTLVPTLIPAPPGQFQGDPSARFDFVGQTWVPFFAGLSGKSNVIGYFETWTQVGPTGPNSAFLYPFGKAVWDHSFLARRTYLLRINEHLSSEVIFRSLMLQCRIF